MNFLKRERAKAAHAFALIDLFVTRREPVQDVSYRKHCCNPFYGKRQRIFFEKQFLPSPPGRDMDGSALQFLQSFANPFVVGGMGSHAF